MKTETAKRQTFGNQFLQLKMTLCADDDGRTSDPFVVVGFLGKYSQDVTRMDSSPIQEYIITHFQIMFQIDPGLIGQTDHTIFLFRPERLSRLWRGFNYNHFFAYKRSLALTHGLYLAANADLTRNFPFKLRPNYVGNLLNPRIGVILEPN